RILHLVLAIDQMEGRAISIFRARGASADEYASPDTLSSIPRPRSWFLLVCRRVLVAQNPGACALVDDGRRPCRVVAVGGEDTRKGFCFAVSPEEHHRFLCRRDRGDPDADPVRWHR